MLENLFCTFKLDRAQNKSKLKSLIYCIEKKKGEVFGMDSGYLVETSASLR